MPNGFTLIELLVVIAIIGLLSSIVLVAMNSTRIKARDVRRKADLAQVVKAMELYYNDHPSNAYTIYGTGWSTGSASSACGCGWFNYQDGSTYITSIANGLVQSGYMAKGPRDPILNSDNQTPQYMLYPCGNGFFVYAHLENPSTEDLATYTNSKNIGCANLDVYTMNYAVGHL